MFYNISHSQFKAINRQDNYMKNRTGCIQYYRTHRLFSACAYDFSQQRNMRVTKNMRLITDVKSGRNYHSHLEHEEDD